MPVQSVPTTQPSSVPKDEEQTPTASQEPIPQSPPDQPSPEIKQKPNKPSVILLVLLIISLGLAGFFGYKYFQSNQQPITDEQPAPTATATPDPTANWETYTNPILNFSFRTPSELPVIETNTSYNYYEGSAVTVSTEDIYKTAKIKPCEPGNASKPCLVKGSGWGQEKDIEPVNINNNEALNFYIWNEYNTIVNVVEFPSPFIQIATFVDGRGLKERFDQILSTFEFIDQSKTLKKFEGQAYPYSFSYPSYFEVKINPNGSYPKQETANFHNKTTNSPISLLEFRTVEAYYPEYPDNKAIINGNTFWYYIFPEYPGGGQVFVMAEKDKEMIYELRFTGTKTFEDAVIQQIISSFAFR